MNQRKDKDMSKAESHPALCFAFVDLSTFLSSLIFSFFVFTPFVAIKQETKISEKKEPRAALFEYD